MRKQYITPLCEDIQLDPLMDGIAIVDVSGLETADAPSRGQTLKYL